MDAKVQIGLTADFLEGVSVDTTAGTNMFREGVVVSDPTNPTERQRVVNGASYVVDPKTTGAWGYKSGVDGTPSIPSGAKVLQITATSIAGGSFTINGGDTVMIPPYGSISIEPKGNLIAPVLVFTSTSGYFVEYVL